jgi:hypothetical protein
MNDSTFHLDPSKGVVCSRAGHLVAEQPNRIPACLRCGKGLCLECHEDGARLVTCQIRDPHCANT